jgi:hypothetical protein
MPETTTKGEVHGCIVCGKPYQLYVVYDAQGHFIDCKVMSAGAKRVHNRNRALVSCEHHAAAQVEAAVARAYGEDSHEDDESDPPLSPL